MTRKHDSPANPTDPPQDPPGTGDSGLPSKGAGRGAPAEPEMLPAAGGGIVPSDPLRRYLAELRHYPRISREEEHRLAVKYREEGDREAALALVTANLRLVVRIAMDYRRSYLNLLDLIQEGNIGLLHAVKKYDPYRGVPFSAYAGYWIRAYVIKHLLDHWSLVRVGTTNVRRKLFYNLKREKELLEREGIHAGPKLLAEKFGAEEQDVIEVSQALKGRDISIDAPRRGSEDGRETYVWETLSDGAQDPAEQASRRQMQELLREKITAFASRLKDRDRYILEKRLVAEDPLTLQAIGDHFGTTREAVRQAEARLVKRLKEYLTAEIGDLKEFDVRAG